MYRSRKYSWYSDRCGVAHCYTKYGGLIGLYGCGSGDIAETLTVAESIARVLTIIMFHKSVAVYIKPLKRNSFKTNVMVVLGDSQNSDGVGVISCLLKLCKICRDVLGCTGAVAVDLTVPYLVVSS